MKKVIYILMFLVLFQVGYSANLVTFNETFNSADDYNVTQNYLTNVSASTTSTINHFDSDFGRWYVGILDYGVAKGTDVTRVNTYWSFGAKQLWTLIQPATNQDTVVFYNFPYYVGINNNSQINLIANTSTAGIVEFYFIDNTDTCVYAFSNSNVLTATHVNSFCGGTVTESCTWNDVLGVSIPKKYNISFGECDGGINNYNNIVRVAYIPAIVSSNDIYLDYVEFQDFINGTNELPKANFSFNKNVLCINNSGEQAYFNATINASDSENDTIYYSLDASTYVQNFTVNYNIYQCRYGIFGCSNQPDYSFLNNIIYPTTNTCEISTDYLNDYSIVAYDNENSVDVNMLGIHSVCNNTDWSVYYELDKYYSEYIYETKIHGFATVNESFNITLFDTSLQNPVIQFQVLRDNNTNYFRNFVGDTVEYYSNWTSSTSLLIQVLSNISNGRYSITFTDLDNTLKTSVYGLPVRQNGSNVKIQQISVDLGTAIYQEYFSVGGKVADINFSTSKPLGIIFYDYGAYPVNLFVTDSVNILDNVYNSYSAYLTVVNCDSYASITVEEKTKIALDTIRNIQLNTCQIFDNIFGFNGKFGVCKIIYWVYMFFGIMLSLIISLALSRFGLTISASIFYILIMLWGFIGSFIFNFSRTTIFVFALLGTIGVINIIRVLFFGAIGSNTGD